MIILILILIAKLIILICGDNKTGKHSIVNEITKDKDVTKTELSSFQSILFDHEEVIGKSKISIPIELRILGSDQLDTELKMNKTFFAEALGAFVVNSITDNNLWYIFGFLKQIFDFSVKFWGLI